MQNFVCTIVESQYMNGPSNDEHSKTTLASLMERLNLFFTIIFTMELGMNAFCYWLRPFIQNMWNILDTFIIVMSLVSTVLTNEPTGIVRVLRALRVIRLFGRVKSLKKIISALTMAVLPVLNVFLILFLLIGIGAFPPLAARCRLRSRKAERRRAAFRVSCRRRDCRDAVWGRGAGALWRV